jgi:hypothetical protein
MLDEDMTTLPRKLVLIEQIAADGPKAKSKT